VPSSEPRLHLTVAEALAEVLALADARGSRATEEVVLAGALGRVLAVDVRAPVDLPPWDNAAMDGWAVRAADVLGARADAPVRLAVVGAARAGAPWPGTVAAGQAVRIATGAPLPVGADCVVRVEDSRGERTDVLLHDDRDARAEAGGGSARRNVRPRGEDVRAGAVAVAAGTRLEPGALGVLASVGAARVSVARRPRVAILASGDELVALDDPVMAAALAAGRAIVSSNSVTLAALVRAAGGEPRDLGLVADRRDALRDRLATAVADGADLVLTTAGVSVGERDHVREAVAAAGGRVRFWRVRMRPGGPLAGGTLPAADGGAVPWLGLPGNPVSTMVTFALFARPLLARLTGDRRPFARTVPARLAEPVRTPAPLAHYLRATLATGADGALEARLTGPQGSGLLGSMALAEALLVVPASVSALDAGAVVRLLLLGEGAPRAATPDAHAHPA
jgi:molybdopterin molybdotransferase